MSLERNKLQNAFYLFDSKGLEARKNNNNHILFCHLLMSSASSHYHSFSLSVHIPNCSHH